MEAPEFSEFPFKFPVLREFGPADCFIAFVGAATFVPGQESPQLFSAGMSRRAFFPVVGALLFCPTRLIVDSYAQPSQTTLLSAPLELGGDWGASPLRAATLVLSRIRDACLSGLKLYSDQQPAKLRVDNHSSGYPAIWLHNDPAETVTDKEERSVGTVP